MASGASHLALLEKLGTLRLHVQEDRKPGNQHKRIVLVAVVRHGFKKPDSALTDQDVVWINCSASKDIEALTRAYVNQQEDDARILIAHESQVLEPKTKISALTRDGKDTLVALRAHQITNTATLDSSSNPVRAVLGPITNAQRAPPRTSSAKPTSSAKATANMEYPYPVTQPATQRSPDGGQTPSSRTAHSSMLSLMLPPPQQIIATGSTQTRLAPHYTAVGWEDYLASRLSALQLTEMPGKQAKSITDLAEHDCQLATDWNALPACQKLHLINRSKKTVVDFSSAHSTFVQRYSFWSFFHVACLECPAQSVPTTFEGAQDYFEQVLQCWRRKTRSSRSLFYAGFLDVCHAIEARGALTTPGFHDTSKQDAIHGVAPVAKAGPSQLNMRSPVTNLVVKAASPASSPTDLDSKVEVLPELHTRVKDEDFHVDLEDVNDSQSSGPIRLTMSELFDGRTAEQLESSVESGVHLLSRIGRTLRSQPSQDSDQWLKAIENVQKQAVRSKTIVGVVGATGAGKSSVINALLDQERLVPTNCMRACTAVVTEISYNYDGDGYRAEIEFVSRADWHKQLKILFEDLIDGSGNVSRDAAKEDSEAGVAYAQIKAVYPNLTYHDMENTTVEKLMEHKNVKCLGSVRNLKHDDSLMFYGQLQHYVDSKEKGQKKDKDKDKNTGREQEFWPLIRVVRLYIKAHALSTGAVIVDLPGVHDSNQARAAVAQGYIKQCTGLWIVAPITRAVDDKSAKNLMGDTFKRQLKLDGGFNDVTFICSKTDDISLTEAQDSLDLGEELGPMWSQVDDLDNNKKKLQKSIEEHKAARGDITAAMDDVDDQLDLWNELSEKHSNGETVRKPKPKSQKRKRSKQSSSPRKKSKSADRDSDDDFDDTDSDAERSDDDDDDKWSEEQSEPLAEDEIAAKIAELKATKKDGRRQRLNVDEEVKQLRRQVADVEKERATIEAVISAKCIAGRNDYSRDAIRQDYAAGIRELDQELAEEEDAANFDPEEDARDYDEVARNLPVYCVSSRAYQKLQGRHAKERRPPGFEHIDETEMPALQAHCIKLTDKTRLSSCRRFLTSVFQLLNSLRLWASNDGAGRNLTEGQMTREGIILKEKMKKLDSALEDTVNSTVDSIIENIEDKLFDNMPAAIDAAKLKAVDTATRWGSHTNEGGLCWSTYKATCRRDGVFTGSGGLHNFNAQLLEPVLQRIAGPWESIFSRCVPKTLALLPNSAGHLLTTFHKDQEKRAIRNGVSIAAFQMLQQQISVYRDVLKDAMDEIKGQIMEQQREINRELAPRLQQSMLDAYAVCVAEVGKGQYNRMKVHMTTQVGQTKDTMFDDCVDHVRELINRLFKGTRERLLEKMDAIYLAVKQEYTSVVIGRDTDAGGTLPREQRSLRKNVLEIVDSADHKFQQAVGLAPPDENQEESSTEPGVNLADADTDAGITVGTGDDAESTVERDVPAVEEEHRQVDDFIQGGVLNVGKGTFPAHAADGANPTDNVTRGEAEGVRMKAAGEEMEMEDVKPALSREQSTEL